MPALIVTAAPSSLDSHVVSMNEMLTSARNGVSMSATHRMPLPMSSTRERIPEVIMHFVCDSPS